MIVYVFLLPLLVVGFGIWFTGKQERARSRFTPFAENRLRLPGHSLRVKERELRDELDEGLIGLILVLAALVVLIVSFDWPWAKLVFFLFMFTAAFGFVFRFRRLFKRFRSNSLGLEGEEYVGQELNFLMLQGAYVFHDLEFSYGNLDHVVISGDRVLVVETKAYKKPAARKGDAKARCSRVEYNGSKLVFPHFFTDEPLKQAALSAQYLQKKIQAELNFDFEVVPVVALPGWFVSCTYTTKPKVIVCNPKRGKFLRSVLGEREQNTQSRAVAKFLSKYAYTVEANKKFDPDASEYFDAFMNPRPAAKEKL